MHAFCWPVDLLQETSYRSKVSAGNRVVTKSPHMRQRCSDQRLQFQTPFNKWDTDLSDGFDRVNPGLILWNWAKLAVVLQTTHQENKIRMITWTCIYVLCKKNLNNKSFLENSSYIISNSHTMSPCWFTEVRGTVTS